MTDRAAAEALVPEQVSQEVIKAVTQESAALQLCRNARMSSKVFRQPVPAAQCHDPVLADCFDPSRQERDPAMGIVLSLILMGVGAILTWGVNSSGGSVNIDVVGIVLMVVGFILFVLSLILWDTWWGPGFWGAGPAPDPYGGGTVVRRRTYRPTRRRTTYVEEDPPAGPPY